MLRVIIHPNSFQDCPNFKYYASLILYLLFSYNFLIFLEWKVWLTILCITNMHMTFQHRGLLLENLRYNSKFRIQDENEIVFKFLIMLFLKYRGLPPAWNSLGICFGISLQNFSRILNWSQYHSWGCHRLKEFTWILQIILLEYSVTLCLMCGRFQYSWTLKGPSPNPNLVAKSCWLGSSL